MSIATPPRIEPEQRFLLDGVSWEFYERLLAELHDRPIRVTYDRGRLELMAPSYLHENYGRFFSLLLGVLAEELNMPIKGAGSTTFRREDVARGLEPDECFYIQNIAAILGKTEIDLTIDPPPDLAIEIDLTRGSLNRMEIYAALRVPEIWRYNGQKLRVFLLSESGVYEEQPQSALFPVLPLPRLPKRVKESLHLDETALRRELRTWVRRLLKPPKRGR